MTSQLLDKLEILKSKEIKLQEEQRFLVEQISLEMEKKRRLKMEGTLTKLEVQVDELAENFDDVLMPNNFEAVLYKMEQDLQKMNQSSRNYQIKQSEIQTKKYQYRKQEIVKKITLGEFQKNLDLIGEETKDTLLKDGLSSNYYSEKISCYERAKEQLLIKPEMKIYSDIVPLFRTMIGIMEKQQKEIDELKSKF